MRKKNFAGLALRGPSRECNASASTFSAPSLLRCRATAGDVKEIFRRPDSFLFLSNAAWRAENPDPVGNFSPLTGRISREAGSEIMNHSLTGAAMIRIVVAFATVSAVILIIGGVVGYLMPRF